VRVVEGEGGRGAILPRLRAEVVVEARAGGHRLGVEVGRERAVLEEARCGTKVSVRLKSVAQTDTWISCSHECRNQAPRESICIMLALTARSSPIEPHSTKETATREGTAAAGTPHERAGTDLGEDSTIKRAIRGQGAPRNALNQWIRT
jgi:hypothetical protein